MYLSGDCGCGGGCADCGGAGYLGDYLGDYLGATGPRESYLYLGQDPTPWWEQLIYTGEKIATNVLQQRPSTLPTYGGSQIYTPPMFPASYPPATPYTPAPAPGPIAGATNWLPYVLVGGLALYLLTR